MALGTSLHMGVPHADIKMNKFNRDCNSIIIPTDLPLVLYGIARTGVTMYADMPDQEIYVHVWAGRRSPTSIAYMSRYVRA